MIKKLGQRLILSEDHLNIICDVKKLKSGRSDANFIKKKTGYALVGIVNEMK